MRRGHDLRACFVVAAGQNSGMTPIARRAGSCELALPLCPAASPLQHKGLYHLFACTLQRARTALLLMNCIAIIGYASFPLMPPRLVPDCATKYGGCDERYTFVDTMDTLGGIWSWRGSALEGVSNSRHVVPTRTKAVVVNTVDALLGIWSWCGGALEGLSAFRGTAQSRHALKLLLHVA